MQPVPSTPVGKYYCRTLELQKFVVTGISIFMQFFSHLLKNTFLSQPSTPCFPVLEPWHHPFGETRVMSWWVWDDQGACIQNYGKKTQSRHILEITCSKYTSARPVLWKQTDSRICYSKGWREIIWHPHPTTTAYQLMTWFTHCSEKFVKQQLGLNHCPIRFMIIHCQVSLKEQSSTPTKWENTMGEYTGLDPWVKSSSGPLYDSHRVWYCFGLMTFTGTQSQTTFHMPLSILWFHALRSINRNKFH